MIPGSGRSPGVGNGNPLQNSCLENSMNRGAWRATIHGVAKTQTLLSDHTHVHSALFISSHEINKLVIYIYIHIHIHKDACVHTCVCKISLMYSPRHHYQFDWSCNRQKTYWHGGLSGGAIIVGNVLFRTFVNFLMRQ